MVPTPKQLTVTQKVGDTHNVIHASRGDPHASMLPIGH